MNPKLAQRPVPSSFLAPAPYAKPRLRYRWMSGVLLLLALGIGTSAQASETSLTLDSELGDFVGGGQRFVFTSSDGTFSAEHDPLNNRVIVSFSTSPFSHFWSLDFNAPAGQSLGVGTYNDATRFSFFPGSEPGLAVYGDGRGCNSLTGAFEIRQVVYGPGDTIVSFWATFQQHCENDVPALRGDIRYNADVTVAVTAPLEKLVEKGQFIRFGVSATDVAGRPVVLSLLNPPSGSSFVDHGDNTGTFTWTPGLSQGGVYPLVFHGDNGEGGANDAPTRMIVTGINSLLLDSEPGDYIGEGLLQNFTTEDGRFFATPMVGSGLVVGMNIYFYSYLHYYTLSFGGPTDEAFHVGVYTGARNFQSPYEPGMDIYGDGRACGSLTGSFEVKELVVGPNNRVDAFWATFEQRCGQSTAALRGEIRYKADVPLLVLSPTNVSGRETDGIQFDISVLVDGGIPVALTAPSLPAGASLVDHGDNTATFDWTPARGQAGQYTVSFMGDAGSGLVDRAFTRLRVALSNDDFDNPLPITDFPFTEQVNFNLATIAPDDPPCSYTDPSVWYRITPPADTRIRFTLTGEYSAFVSVFTGSRGALNQVACSSQSNPLIFSATGGQTYYLLAAAYASTGSYTVMVEELPPPPVNDEIGHATLITDLPFNDAIDTTYATIGVGDPYCVGSGATVWYRFTPSQDVLVDTDTFGSDFPTTLSAYVGNPGALSPVLCAFDHGIFTAHAGQTYFFMVGSYYGSPGGHLKFSVIGLPPFTLDLGIDAVGSVSSKTGLAAIRGQLHCSRPSQAHLSGLLRQRIGRAIISATFELETRCDEQSSWSVVLASSNGLFTGGNAEVQLFGFAIDDRTGEGAQDQADADIRLRGTKKGSLLRPSAAEPIP